MTTINVCGVLIHTRTEYAEEVRAKLENEEGVEVHSVTDNGRLVVTVEKKTQQETGDTINDFQELDHVISTSVVYQYFDQEAENEWQKSL